MNRRKFFGAAAVFAPVAAIVAKAFAAVPTKGNRLLDFQNKNIVSVWYDVFDANTGEDLGKALPITYADEARGVIRVLRQDANGRFVQDPTTKRAVRDQFRREIRILPKPQHADAVALYESGRKAEGLTLLRKQRRSVI